VTGVVVDSNLYISALVFGGLPQQLLDLIEITGVPLHISSSIIDEVSGTLTRKFGWTEERVEEFLPPLWARCTLTRLGTRLSVCPDLDDNHVLECAVAAGADYLVTGNIRHFPRDYGGIHVVTARRMMERLAAPGD